MALARALAIEPRVLLLDEPFGALDAKVRKELRRWLRELHDQTGHTTLFVTHDQDEAFELADRVAILNQGKVEQVGSPRMIQQEPASAFVAAFVEGHGPPEACSAQNRAKSGFLPPAHTVSGGLTCGKKPGIADSLVKPAAFYGIGIAINTR